MSLMSSSTNYLAPTPSRFLSNGSYCAADLYLPLGTGPFPVLVMAHGLGATRNMRLPAFAERFVAAGYACLVFDYRHFGESEGEPRQLLDIGRQLEDWKAALSHVRQLANIDAQRIVIWGTSFSGGHVLAIAAEDAGVAAVISQCPFTDGLASILTIKPLVSLRVTALALADRIGAIFGARPRRVAIADRLGKTALMTAPGAYEGYFNLVPTGAVLHNYIAARFALDIIRYYPGRKTPSIHAPVLFCVCDPDTEAPAKRTLHHAHRAPRGEVKRYPYGHFDIYVGEAFEHVVRDQLNFLQRHLPVAAASSKSACAAT